MLKYFKRDYVTDFNAAFTNKYKSSRLMLIYVLPATVYT